MICWIIVQIEFGLNAITFSSKLISVGGDIMLSSFRIRLFITYLIVTFFFTTVIGIPLYYYLKSNMQENSLISVEQKALGVSSRLDQLYQIYRSITQQIYMEQIPVSSNNSATTIVQYFDNLSKGMPEMDLFHANLVVHTKLSILSEIQKEVNRISLYTADGKFYSNKEHSADIAHTISESQMDYIRAAQGGPVLAKVQSDPWLAASSTNQSGVITFTRQLRIADQEVGFLEVQFLESELLPMNVNDSSTSYFIFGEEQQLLGLGNASKNQVAPISVNEAAAYMSKHPEETGIVRFPSSKDSRDYYIAIHSQKTGYIAICSINKQSLFATLYLFRNITIVTITLFILFSIGIFYILSKRLSLPLINLRKAIDSISLGETTPDIENKDNADEIGMLNRSFRKMNERLQHSLEEVVQFRTIQLQSHFETLQAQINPHFLFNMLGVIKAMADRTSHSTISEISGKLAQFLKYPISTKEPVVDLEKEFQFVSDYLLLLKNRYLHRLEYSIDFTEAEAFHQIPKLTLQPLVENSIHHGLTGRQPVLHIQISARSTDEEWELQVKDDGKGFDTDKITDIRKQMQEYSSRISRQQTIDPLQIGGMGLISTFIRLKMLYKDQMSFDFGNNPEGGAFVRFTVTKSRIKGAATL